MNVWSKDFGGSVVVGDRKVKVKIIGGVVEVERINLGLKKLRCWM